jgi:hypothetical protein
VFSVSSLQLEEFWNLEEPSFGYLARTFALTYKFSEGIADASQTQAKLYLYGNIDEPNADANCFQGDAVNENEYQGSSLDITKDEFGINGLQTAYENGKEETVSVLLDTLTIASDATVFTDNNDGTNLIAFCVRYGLYTGGGAANSYEVNFLETLVELRVDLRGDFTVTDIVVAPKDKLKRTANIDYGLMAFQCTGKDADGGGILKVFVEGEGTFNQGDVITICVEPDEIAKNDGVYMKQVERFEYVLLEEGSNAETDTRQLAIDITNAAAGVRGAMFGLTNIDACLGEIACKIETILFATFYTRPGTVTGAGVATMQFGISGSDGDFTQRKLRGGDASRALQADEAASGDFDVNFQISSNDSFERNSGASSSLSILALVGSTAAALML